MLVRLAFGPPVPPELLPGAFRQKGYVPRILPDMGVKVAFHGAETPPADAAPKPVTLVPRTAVRSTAGTTVVFVITGEQRVERRAVKVGAEQSDRLEILSGLNSGEKIVVEGVATLADGARIQER